MDDPVVLQTGPETFQVLPRDGRALTVTLPQHLRTGLGLQGVPPLVVAREIVRFLRERDALPEVADEPLPLGAAAARHPGFVDELRARLV